MPPLRFQDPPRGTESRRAPVRRRDYLAVPIHPIGFNFDHLPEELTPEVWTDGAGVVFRGDSAERQHGEETLTDTALFAAQYLLANEFGSVAYWLYPGADGIGLFDGVAHFDITPAVDPPLGAAAFAWTGGNLNNLAVLNQGGHTPPWYWDGQPGNPMLPLPGWPAGQSCEALRPFKFNLFALNIDGPSGTFSDLLAWSSSADPGDVPSTWTAAPDNDAGTAQLADTPGHIVDALAMRDNFYIYKQHSVYLAQYVAGQFVYLFRNVISSSGMLSRNCAAEIRGRHLVLTDGDIMLFDGQSPVSLIQDRIKRWLFNIIDGSNYESCFVQSYNKNSEVWVCFPETGNTFANLALVWDLNTDAWGVRSLIPEISYIGRGIVPDTSADPSWDGDAGAWDADVTSWSTSLFNPTQDGLVGAAAAGSQLFVMDVGTTNYDGSPVEAYLVRESMRMEEIGGLSKQKLIVACWPKIDSPGNPTVQINIGVQSVSSAPISWIGEQDFIVGVSRRLEVLAVGRLISFKLSSSGGEVWRCAGFALELRDAGLF